MDGMVGDLTTGDIRPSIRRLRLAHRLECRSGIALLVVLALLLLVLGLTMAFFSRAILSREIGASSAENARVGWLSNYALDLIQSDLIQELKAGSQEEIFSAAGGPNQVLYQPIITTNSAGERFAPSMVPQRSGVADLPGLLKQSRRDVATFSGGAGFQAGASGVIRASPANTSHPSRNDRSIPATRWNAPRLIADDEFSAYEAPDWIYVAPDGSTPILADDPATAQPLGRFAYTIYDVGGLLDITVAGNTLADNSHRGRLHQIMLDSLMPSASEIDDFIGWRWPLSGGDSDASRESNGLFDPTRTFLSPMAGEQTFVNRQDLIRRSEQFPAQIPEEALPLLTVFQRDTNAPYWDVPSPTAENPDVARVRISNLPAESTLDRPNSDPIPVSNADPVMPRRFPLSMLSLLEEEEPDEDAIRYYFGLEKLGPGRWEYVHGITEGGVTRIATLAEVADGSAPNPKAGPDTRREPNFFEVLQAAITSGSLGTAGDNSYQYEATYGTGPGQDTSTALQSFRIGANVIDQWDADDLPTRIEIPSNDPLDPILAIGVENLPYISQVHIVPHQPEENRDNFEVWAAFDLWNPHQNAEHQPDNIDNYRIIPIGGRGQLIAYHWPFSDKNPDTSPKYGLHETSFITSYLEINLNQEVLIDANTDYSVPTLVGSASDGPGNNPGLLLLRYEDVPISIHPRGSRPMGQQLALNQRIDEISPYSATEAVIGEDSDGRREYPPGTTFTDSDSGDSIDTDLWLVEDEGSDGVFVSANYGVKAHNAIRFWPNTADPITFELQARFDGEWVPIQRFEDWYRPSDGPQKPLDTTKSQVLLDTHHSVGDVDNDRSFYTWMERGGVASLIRADPRTSRFGTSGICAWRNYPTNPNLNHFSGYTVRSDSSAPPLVNGNIPSNRRNSEQWIRVSGNYGPGGEHSRFQKLGTDLLPFGLVSNHPTQLSAAHPFRYADGDGVVRPADGYLGTLPTIPGRLPDRPIILNRPFRSVAEMGFAFRDLPWKSLDFFTSYSGDLALLEAFSLDEPAEAHPLVAGKLNLNTARTDILKAIVQGATKQFDDIAPSVSGAAVSETEASDLADAITAAQDEPFLSRADLVRRVTAADKAQPLLPDSQSDRRELAIAPLIEMGSTRTWNVLIDCIVQTGEMPPNASGADDFVVRAERRVWLHLAIDRFTGEIVDQLKETVDE